MNPVIILVEPQLGENIGATARVMANFGLDELRIVSPRDGWPNQKAIDMAVAAKGIVENAKIFDSIEQAISDIQYLASTSSRERNLERPNKTPRQLAEKISQNNVKSGIMFGRERCGLTNEDVVLSDDLVSIPVSPDYPSLNIAQSVSIICYELYLQKQAQNNKNPLINNRISPKRDILELYNHLESELERRKYFRVPEKRRKMVNNMRNMLSRMNMTEQETRTFRGIIDNLTSNEVDKQA